MSIDLKATSTDLRFPFAQTLEELAESDPRIVVLVNDSVSSSNVGGFGKKYGKRLINVGIAEQNMVGMAAGLANSGKVPFVCSAGSFLTGRALEQIKADICYSDANVKLVGMSSGVAYGALGATHHSIEDFAWLRAIANLTIIAPADASETRQAVRSAVVLKGPVYLRLSRLPVPEVHADGYRFEVGKGSVVRRGDDVTIIANGIMVARAVEAAKALSAQGIEARVINLATVKPLDREIVVRAARETGAIVTVEEHTVFGGLGGAVAEVVVEDCPVPMRILGIPGVFAPVGDASYILDSFGLGSEGIARAAAELLVKKSGGKK